MNDDYVENDNEGEQHENDDNNEDEANDEQHNHSNDNNDQPLNNSNEEETKTDPYEHLPKSLQEIIKELQNKNVLNILIKPKQQVIPQKAPQQEQEQQQQPAPEQLTPSTTDDPPVTLEALLESERTHPVNKEHLRKPQTLIEIDIENIEIIEIVEEPNNAEPEYNESASVRSSNKPDNFFYDPSATTNIGAPIDIDIDLECPEMKPFSFKAYDNEHLQFHQKPMTLNEIFSTLSSAELTTRYTQVRESRPKAQAAQKRSKNLSIKKTIRKVINSNKIKQLLPLSKQIPYKRNKVDFKKTPLDYILLVDSVYFSQTSNSFSTATEIENHIKAMGLDFKPSKHAKSAKLNEMFLSEVITYLVNKSRIIDVTYILLGINPEMLNESMVKQAIQGTKLVNAFTYLITHSGERSDFMKPLEYMYTLFVGVDPSDKYNQFMGCAIGDVSVIQCKQYFGHRIFWYCNFCLDKLMFPERYPIDDDVYALLVPKIFLFLSSDEICRKLVEFDSFTYFTVYSRFFCDNEINKLININYAANEDIYLNYQGAHSNDPHYVITPLKMLENVLGVCVALERDNVYILNDAFDFVDKYYNNPMVENEVRISKGFFHAAVKHFLDYEYMIQRLTNEYDPFMCHELPEDYDEAKLKLELEDKAIRLLKQVDGEEHEKDKFGSDEIELLVKDAFKNHFTRAEIMLYTMDKNYVEVLHCKVKMLLKQGDNSSDDQVNELFQWIQFVLYELNGKDKKEVEKKNNFVDAFYTQFIHLCNISILRVLEVIKKHLYKDHSRIIETLQNNPPLQFDFLKRFLGEHEDMKNSAVPNIAIDIEIQDEIDQHQANAKQQSEDYYDNDDGESALNTIDQLYLQLIKLSLDLGEKKLLSKILRSRPNLCNKEVLELLNQHKAYENAIYVCQVIGGYSKGIKMTVLAIRNTYTDITNNFKSNVFRETKNVYYLQKLKRLISLGIEICNAQSNAESYTEWIDLLEVLYDFRSKFKKFRKVFKAKYLDYEFKRVDNTILSGLESILEVMENHFKIEGLVEFISSNCKNAGYIEFRQLFMKQIYSLRKSLRLFERSLKILQDITKKEFFVLLDSKRKGKLYTLGVEGRSKLCMVCKESLSYQRKGEKKGKSIPVIIFPCDHYYHTNCCAYEGEGPDNYVCAVCRQEEIDAYPGYLKTELFVPSVEEEEKDNEEKKEGEEGIEKAVEEALEEDTPTTICGDAGYRNKKKSMLKNFREKMIDKHNEVDKMIKSHGKVFRECGEGDETETDGNY